MKARKLVMDKNINTGREHQNVVWFGSYGYEVAQASHAMLLYRSSNEGPLVIAPDLLIAEDLLIQGSNPTWYDYFYLNLYFTKGEEEQFITITTTNQNRFSWLVQFNALNKNENVIIQKLGIGQEECRISIDELIDEFGHYEMISNFMIAIMQEGASSPVDEFTIDYPTRKSKLVYQPKENYTYSESQLFNYSTRQQGVRDALIPRLSVIKGELWYKPSYGLPLMEKIRSKGIYDSIIVNYIVDYTDVINLEEFSSTFKDHTYTFDCVINTVYNEKINISKKL